MQCLVVGWLPCNCLLVSVFIFFVVCVCVCVYVCRFNSVSLWWCLGMIFPFLSSAVWMLWSLVSSLSSLSSLHLEFRMALWVCTFLSVQVSYPPRASTAAGSLFSTPTSFPFLPFHPLLFLLCWISLPLFFFFFFNICWNPCFCRVRCVKLVRELLGMLKQMWLLWMSGAWKHL